MADALKPVTVSMSMDSGSVAHVAGPDMLPAATIQASSRVKGFRAANGEAIAHHGSARVTVVGEKMPWRKAVMQFEAADVTRALQSTGVTCDHGKEVLFTKGACYVVPKGTLSPYLRREDICQAFAREPGGGLYSRNVTVSAPPDSAPQDGALAQAPQHGSSPEQSASHDDGADSPAATFQRPGRR